MNVLVFELAKTENAGLDLISRDEIIVEDNVGEGVHVHWRNIRVEMSIDDFGTFTEELTTALRRLDDGNY
ncbi:hypothetical protein [Halorhabdus salina]|uniref:hypothetical protein n=1 Tax=Halorhabdus salina TaxID=2750670 RepID=UPI0015EE88E1|nr:hypothetical protein [Halorhabdus salina]